jgi:hypothetical protein
MILLKRSPHCGSAIMDSMLASVFPKDRGWMNNFFVVFLTTGSNLGTYSKCLMVPGEEPFPVFDYFIFGALSERLVVGFLRDIVFAT